MTAETAPGRGSRRPPARRALVTGGAGFIGSHLVDRLAAGRWDVTVLDDISSGRRDNLVGAFNRGARLVEGSVTDAEAVARAFDVAAPCTVFHLAAQIDVRRAVADPAADGLVNVLGTINVLEGARRAGATRVVLASTGGAIYGDAAVVPTPETEAARPQSPYAESKLAAEGYLALYRGLHGLSTFALRLANVYGPRQDPRGEAGVIAVFCAGAGGEATVYGDGLQTRDFVYVADVVEAFLAAGAIRAGGFCNVGTGRETTVLELARRLGITPHFAPARPGEVRRSCLDASAAADVLGWRARTLLATGLRHTLAAAGAPPVGSAIASP